MDSIPRSRGFLVVNEPIELTQTNSVIFESFRCDFVMESDRIKNLTMGSISIIPCEDDEENEPDTFNTYVTACRDVLKSKREGLDLLIAHGSGSFHRMRAAIVAAAEMPDTMQTIPIIRFDESGTSADGWEPLAQLVALQALGCDGVLIDCEDDKSLRHVAGELAEYSTVPMALWSDKGEISSDMAEIFSHIIFKPESSPEGLNQEEYFKIPMPEYGKTDEIIAVTNGKPWLIDPLVDISEEILCDESFERSLLEAEADEAPVTKVEIADEDALDIFETAQYMLTEPVCIYSNDESIFARAVRMFCGVAIYDGTCQVSDDLLANLKKRYGLIIL